MNALLDVYDFLRDLGNRATNERAARNSSASSPTTPSSPYDETEQAEYSTAEVGGAT
jgi:hypothetical protein